MPAMVEHAAWANVGSLIGKVLMLQTNIVAEYTFAMVSHAAFAVDFFFMAAP